jgi:hypothetical protein
LGFFLGKFTGANSLEESIGLPLLTIRARRDYLAVGRPCCLSRVYRQSWVDPDDDLKSVIWPPEGSMPVRWVSLAARVLRTPYLVCCCW